MKFYYLIAIAAMAVCADADNDLVLHYTFAENGGAVVRDHSGHSHHGTIHGGAQRLSTRFGTALTFDGVDDYIRCEPAPGLDMSSAFTVELRVRAQGNAGGIFSRHTGGSWTDQRLVLALQEREAEQHAIIAAQ